MKPICGAIGEDPAGKQAWLGVHRLTDGGYYCDDESTVPGGVRSQAGGCGTGRSLRSLPGSRGASDLTLSAAPSMRPCTQSLTHSFIQAHSIRKRIKCHDEGLSLADSLGVVEMQGLLQQ